MLLKLSIENRREETLLYSFYIAGLTLIHKLGKDLTTTEENNRPLLPLTPPAPQSVVPVCCIGNLSWSTPLKKNDCLLPLTP